MLPKKVAVSVICTTFNQVSYIEQCLKSLINQQTNFDYEIIVHDDASTDGTAEVVREYAEKNPDLIVPIFESENQYSRGVALAPIIDQYLSEPKYVALCEGDDWWTSSQKLQTQFDYMESHPECALCVHNVALYDEVTKHVTGVTPGISSSKVFSIEDIISGDGGLFGTNSMFYRMKYRVKPVAFEGWGVGDYPTCIWLASCGTVYCLSKNLSTYRTNASGSWTVAHRDPCLVKASNEKIIQGLKRANEYFENRYSELIDRQIAKLADGHLWAAINYRLEMGQNRLGTDPEFDAFAFIRRQTTNKLKLNAFLKLFLPRLVLFLRKLKRFKEYKIK